MGFKHAQPFIVFEGIDGSGKTTQAQLLSEHLHRRGINHYLTRQPGGTDAGAEIRQVLMSDSHKSPLTELFLFAADRAEHVPVIREKLESGHAVISDRYTYSTMAYQAYGRGLHQLLVHGIQHTACQGLYPDFVYLIDVEPEQGQRRREAAGGMSRFDRESLDFFHAVRKGFGSLSEYYSQYGTRFVTLDGRWSPEVVHQNIIKDLKLKGMNI